jgi:hypothetical protein
MNDRNFEQLLDAWMDLGPHVAPARVADAVRLEARSTRQMPAALSAWATRRFPSMNNYLRIGAAAAVVAIAAALGYGYLIAPNVGAPGPVDPAPTPAPTAAPLPSAVPFDIQPAGELLDPGSYFTTVAGHRITFTVPAGWQPNIVPHVVWTQNSEVRLGFGEIENIYRDPCQPDIGVLDPPPGRTADDLASALASIPGVTATTADAEVSGFSARYVELDVPGAFGNCIPDGGEALLNSDGPLEPALHRFWVVDVDGDRVVISSVARRAPLAQQVEELAAIVESIHIDTP